MTDIFTQDHEVSISVGPDFAEWTPSTLVGKKARRFLILDGTDNTAALNGLQPGAPCRIKMTDSSGRPYQFDTRVLGLMAKPVSVLILSYPQGFESPPPRQAQRHPVRIEAWYSDEPSRGEVDGLGRATILNLSKGGCLMRTATPFLPEHILHLTFDLPEQATAQGGLIVYLDNAPRITDLKIAVRHSQKKDDQYFLGLEFVDQLAYSFTSVRNFMNTLESLDLTVVQD
ncbi:MAG: flagellar brake protein [Proteobacteria bacterium]|nr:flagellar brake protein [Pseudomonadota bacterium]